MHKYLSLAIMTLKLYGIHQHLNRADPQHSASKAYKLINEMTLNHRQWKHLIEVREPDHHNPLISYPLIKEPHVI